MNILMLCGSPRSKKSNSAYIMNALYQKLKNSNKIISSYVTSPRAVDMICKNIQHADALIITFPLYVDGIPSRLLDVMRSIEKNVSGKNLNCTLYAVVNCGFYEAKQTLTAHEILCNWSVKCGLKQGCFLGVGGGEMSQAAPLGTGPSKNLGRSLEHLASDISKLKQSENPRLTEPNFPRFLYKTSAHIGFRMQALKNKVSLKDIKRKV